MTKERRARVYEYTTPGYDKGYVFARNLDSAKRKVPSPASKPDGWSYYAKATKSDFKKKTDRWGRYSP